ncbi:hypothetical protein [Corynebacterium guaraldiae]|uniref:hypothetical protein n=1 Tax=Corynebacterium guaraldiae TaxID=3051103 RepID=UPI001E35E6BD|nr:hypothetical protein [Corynebacterium guaraldiae]
MEIFEGRAGTRRAANGQAIKICRRLYLSAVPTPRQLAEIVSRRWPDSALDGYSAAQQYLGQELTFPLHFLRAGRWHRARTSGAGGRGPKHWAA